MTALYLTSLQRMMIGYLNLRFLATWIALATGLGISTYAQEFTITRTELTANGIILHYDLIDTARTRTYSINVYSSRDNFVAPLQKISGDAGLEIRPGSGKKITWDAKEELGAAFRGDFELEVRGRVYIPFIRFSNLEDDDVIKRGKPKTLLWSGGTRQNILNFNIYSKDNRFVEVIPNVANAGSYDITLPSSIKPGKGYYFLVADSKNKDQVMKSPTFEVKRKVPLLVKALPIVLIGGLVATLPKSSSKDLSSPPETPSSTN